MVAIINTPNAVSRRKFCSFIRVIWRLTQWFKL